AMVMSCRLRWETASPRWGRPWGAACRVHSTTPEIEGSTVMRLLYWLYEFRLCRQIRARPVPGHVEIILDGNRRFARQRGYADPRMAYDRGADKLDDVLAWCIELGIRAVTLWVCSIDNLRRPPEQVAAVLAAVEAKI